MKHKTRSLFLILLAAFAAAGAWLYSRRPRERIANLEGIDDPDAARAFDWVSRTPQMRLLRGYVAARAARLVDRGQAVDVGCGPGYLVLALARRVPLLHVTGVDVSDEMIARGEENAIRAGLSDRVAFCHGDARAIPFPDHSLDFVVSTLSLHHWTDPEAVFDDIARVLRPGGSYLIFDMRRDMPMPGWLLLWFATNVVVPAGLRSLGEPLGSRNAAYTPVEAAGLLDRSALTGWNVSSGPLWLTIEGTTITPMEAGQ